VDRWWFFPVANCNINQSLDSVGVDYRWGASIQPVASGEDLAGRGIYLSSLTSICHYSPSGAQHDMSVMALILVIDDDGFYRGLMERMLTDEGHHVVSAENAIDGIVSYRDRHPDLVITDMRMPGIGGGGVIRTIRRFDSKVRIIAVSGEANFYDIDLLKLAKESGADAILRKLDPLERVVIEANALLSHAA